MQGTERHDVHFHEHSEGDLKGIQKFKTWFRVNKSNVWHGAIRYGKVYSALACILHVARGSNPQIHDNTKTATRTANLIPL